MSFFPPLPKKIKFLTFFITILAAVSFFSFVYADNYQWTTVTNSGSSSDWESVAVSSNGAYAYAVRANDYIYTSASGGDTWTQVSSVGPYQWTSIATSADGHLVVAVANPGEVWVSTDYGGSWISRFGYGLWTTAAVSSDGVIAVGSADGIIEISSDGGISWTSSAPINTRVGSLSYTQDGNLIAAFYGTHIYFSQNNGLSWTQTNDPQSSWVSVVSSNALQTIIAAPTNDNAYISRDTGSTWTAITSLGVKNWKSAAISADGNEIVLVEFNGAIYTSQDNGSTWTSESLVASGQWNGVALTADGTLLLAASSNSYIAKGTLVGGNSIYFSATSDHSWSTTSNFWRDSSFTVPANAIPNSNSDVFVKANVTDNTGSEPYVHTLDVSNDSSINIPITASSTISVHDTSNLASTTTGNANFYDSAGNSGNLIGTAIFAGLSHNGGTIQGSVTFDDSSTNSGGGIVNGNSTFNDSSQNVDGSTLNGDAVFNNTAINTGTVVGNATFNDSSVIGGGGVTGNATFNGDLSGISLQSGFQTVTIDGTRTRRYTSDTTTTRDFTQNGPWTVVADGAVVNISGATYDGSTTFTTLNGGTFTGGSGNVTPGDSTPPTITSVTTSTPDDSYKAGNTVDVTVNFSENVTSTGNVTVTFDTGGSCTFSVTDSSTGSCTYTIGAGDTSSHLNVTSISGSIADQSSNAMNDFTPGTNLADSSDIVVDTTAPIVSITSPTSGTINSFSPSVSWGDAAVCRYKYDLSSYHTITCANNGSDIASPTSGSHTLTILGQDVAGNIGTASVTFTYQSQSNMSGNNQGGGNSNESTTTSVSRPPSSSNGGNSNTVVDSSSDSVINAPAYVISNIVSKLRSILASLLHLVQQNSVTSSGSAPAPSPSADSSNDSLNISPTVPPPVATTTPFSFTRTLKLNDINSDVKSLQIYLNSHGFAVSDQGLGSQGNETEKFGIGTFKALIKFQRSVGISGSGFFGSTTLDYINSHL